MSTITPQGKTDVATVGTPSSGRKLRFEVDEPQPKLRSAMKATGDSKGASPTSAYPSSHSGAADAPDSGRRGSEANSDALRVTVSAAPVEVIEAASSPLVPPSEATKQSFLHSEVAQILADMGVDADGGRKSEPLQVFRPLLQRTAALLLSKRPADPERFLVDHFYSKNLSTSMVAPNARATGTGGSSNVSVHTGAEEHSGNHTLHNATTTTPTTGESDTEGRSFSAGGSGTNVADLDSSSCGGGKSSRTGQQSIAFAPVGDTVAQRLAFPTPLGVSRVLVERMARLLLDVKPSDPENFLWTKLDSRSFSEEVAAATAMAYTTDGFPLLPPEDPTQAALLREVPTNSPGYNVAANVIPLLFAKKPDDPLNYLFLHLTSRARSSIAGSVRSSNNRQRFGEEDNTSCTSRDLGDEFDEDGEHEELDDDMASMSKDDLSPEQDAVVNSFLSNLQRKATTGVAGIPTTASQRSAGSGAGGAARRRSLHSNTGSGGVQPLSHHSHLIPSLRRGNSMGGSSRGGALPAGALRRASRSQSQLYGDASAGSPHTSAGGSKRVCIAEDQNMFAEEAGSAMHEPPSAYYPHSAAGSTAATAGGSSVGEGFYPSFYSSTGAATSGNTSDNSPGAGAGLGGPGEVERLRDEFAVMKLRGAMRLERVGYEVDVLRQERDHLARLASVDRGEHATRALHAASQTLAAAESHLQALEASHRYLVTEMMPRQLRTMATLVEQQQQQQQASRLYSPHRMPAVSPIASAIAGSIAGEVSAVASGVPSELDILRKRVDLLMMEQARLRAMGKDLGSAGAFE